MWGMDGPTEVVFGVAAGLMYLGAARETAKWVYGVVRGSFIDRWIERRGFTIKSTSEAVEDAIVQFANTRYGMTVSEAVIVGVVWPVFWTVWLLFYGLDLVTRRYIVAYAPITSVHERWLLAWKQRERDVNQTDCAHQERTDEHDNA